MAAGSKPSSRHQHSLGHRLSHPPLEHRHPGTCVPCYVPCSSSPPLGECKFCVHIYSLNSLLSTACPGGARRRSGGGENRLCLVCLLVVHNLVPGKHVLLGRGAGCGVKEVGRGQQEQEPAPARSLSPSGNHSCSPLCHGQKTIPLLLEALSQEPFLFDLISLSQGDVSKHLRIWQMRK